MDKPRYLAILGLTLALTGCANLMSVHRTTDFSNGNSSFVDIKQRGVFTNAHFENTNRQKSLFVQSLALMPFLRTLRIYLRS